MDYYFFQTINNLAGRWKILDYFGIFCAEYLIFFLAIAALFLLLNSRKKKVDTFKFFFTVAGSYILKIIIQLFYFRPRPFVDYEVVKLIDKSSTAAFPSGHTLVAFALAFSIYFYNKKLGVIFIFLAVLVGLGRIYTGVHYPFDVIGGIFIAWFIAYAAQKLPGGKMK
jgi:undecaprenyl-diphosphatase